VLGVNASICPSLFFKNKTFIYLLTFLPSMKTINVTFEDQEFKDLETIKGESTTWRSFILTLITPKKR